MVAALFLFLFYVPEMLQPLNQKHDFQWQGFTENRELKSSGIKQNLQTAKHRRGCKCQ